MHRELIVLSHLRWTWVWQRPQHLISRISGAVDRAWFVEEPWPGDVTAAALAQESAGAVERVWLAVPDPGHPVGFEFPYLDAYRRHLPDLIGGCRGERIVWLYSPLALEAARALDPTVLVYDVMDDLAAFKNASPALVSAQVQALEEADVVFAGGRSLHRGVVGRGRDDVHLFPSGVEPEHYRRARGFAVRRDRPVAGYVGVIDERVDLELVAAVADRLPEWDIQMVGPVAKIDPATLPTRPNISFPGAKTYGELPRVMGGFDVALMPFAMNDATRSISPTKTLEYLAAGLPVVSTPVPDVVADFASVVDIQSDAKGFAAACRRVLCDDLADRDRKLEPLLYRHHWDRIAEEMLDLVGACTAVPAEKTA